MPLRFDARQSLTWEKLIGDRYLAHSVLGKAEHPLKYFHWDGKQWKNRIETVRGDELFNDESLLTARAIPILLGHPKSGRYDNNREGLLLGHTFDSFIREDDQLIMPVVVDDLRGVRIINDAIASGKMAEVSPGYSIQGLQQREDGIFLQQGRRYDHLALLLPGQGRGGQTISLRTDSDDIAGAETQYFFINMKTITINDRKFEIEDEVLASEIEGLQSRHDSLAFHKSKLEGELAGVKTRLDEAESNKVTEEAIASDIQERLDTWVVVLPALRSDKKDFQPDYKLPPNEIKQLYLKAKHPNINLDGKDAAFVEGVWEGLKPDTKSEDEQAIDRTDALFDQLNRADAAPKDEEDPLMSKIRDRYKNAHKKTKLGATN
jgi:hypothetical protein